MGTLFADLYGWRFVELDAVNRARLEMALECDREDFAKAGRRTREAPDAGTSVVAEEFFDQE